MNEWTEMSLGQLAAVFDGPHATPTKTESGPWYLSISSLKGGFLDLSESAHLSEEDWPRWTRRVCVEPGDTLFSYETRLGEAAFWSSSARAALGRRMGLLRPHRNVVDPRFLTYAYLGPYFQGQIERRAIRGATVDRIPISEMATWPIRVPPLLVQRRIVGVLGALDDLIEANERLMGRLDALCHAAFLNAWDGETRVPVSQLGEVTMGQSPPGHLINTQGLGTAFHQGTRDFGETYPSTRTHTENGSRRATNDDVLISVRAPVGRVNIATKDIVIGRGLAALSAARPASAYEALRATPSTWASYQDTGTVFAAINGQDLRSAQVPFADQDALEPRLAPLRGMHRSLWDECRTLRSTRDELLPLLMSGRVLPGEV